MLEEIKKKCEILCNVVNNTNCSIAGAADMAKEIAQDIEKYELESLTTTHRINKE